MLAPLSLKPSFGFGDRLGIATPGHIAAVLGTGFAPIFAQQPVRENARTGRTPQQVMDDARRAVESAGWNDPWGADADHLKTMDDIPSFVKAGYTFFTVDPGEYVDDDASHDSLEVLRKKAKDLYISPLFKKNLAYARRLNPDAIYILSAKYGLLDLATEIEPYNLTLNFLTVAEIKEWSKSILHRLSQVADLHNDCFIFLAGIKYRKYLIPQLGSYEVPMEGLPIGKQLQFISKQGGISNMASISNSKEVRNFGKGRSEMAGKYFLLEKYLSHLPLSHNDVTLTYIQIENILNDKLPLSAQRHRAWWSNEIEGFHVQARAWLDAGWLIDTVDLSRKQVKLVRRGTR